MSNKKILVFSIPNDGHLNILKKMINSCQSEFEFQLILVDQKNTRPDLSDLQIPVHILKNSKNFTNTPASMVFKRVDELLGESLEIAKKFAPDLVLYDFTALEGYFVGKILGIPFWSSIPGMMGSLTHSEFLSTTLSSEVNSKHLESIANRYDLAINEADMEVISNCVHIPGELNLLWSYPRITPDNYKENRHDAEYIFTGYIADRDITSTSKRPDFPTIYLSFGTEVMDNLWQKHEETREGIKRCVAGLAERWQNRDLKVIFVTQGKTVLEDYPDNWTVLEKINQQEVLGKSDLFITHGGSNSFHEAILFKVPMVVVPFFGDQMLVAHRAEELGIGIDLGRDENIDTDKSKESLDAELVDQIDKSVKKILGNVKYRENFDHLGLDAVQLLKLFHRG